MQDELRKIDRILEIDEDPKVVLFDHIEEEEAKMAEISQEIQSIKNESEVKNEEIIQKIEEIETFIEDALVSKIDGEDGYTPIKGVDYNDGKDGYTPIKGKDYFDGLPGLDGDTPIKGVDYFDGKDGESIKGDKGDKGDMPKHEWDGAAIRFELPNGEWGEWMNLRGKDGKNGQTYSIFGGGGGDGIRDHGLLQGLGDDDHPQYLKKAGDTMTGTLLFNDSIGANFGTGNDAKLVWDTTDANANMFKLDLPTGGALDVPVFGIGIGRIGVDSGLLNGTTAPTLLLFSTDGASGGYLYHDNTDFNIQNTEGQINLKPTANIVAFPGAVGAGSPRFLLRATTGGQAGFELGEATSSLFFMRHMGNFDEDIIAVAAAGGRQLLLIDTGNRDVDHDIPPMNDPMFSVFSILSPSTDHSEAINLHYRGLRAGYVSNADFVSSTFRMETDRATWDFTVGAVGALATASTNVTGGNLILTGGAGKTEADNGRVKTSTLLEVQKRMLNTKGADVASANDTTLGLDGNYFDITGTTQINGIAVANWIAGSIIVLQFDSTPTVKHNTAASAGFASILLAGAADFVASANDTLVLIYDGTTWREISRTVI